MFRRVVTSDDGTRKLTITEPTEQSKEQSNSIPSQEETIMNEKMIEATQAQAPPAAPIEPEVLLPDDDKPTSAPPPSGMIPWNRAGILPSLITDLRESLEHDADRIKDECNRIKKASADIVKLTTDYAQETENALADQISYFRKRGV